jgi:hypothetical protein
MKIIDPEIIYQEEKMLFHSLNGIIDPAAVQENFRKSYNLEISPQLNFTKGDLVCNEKNVFFNLTFNVPLEFSILIDRHGNHLGFTVQKNKEEESAEGHDADLKLLDIEVIKRREKEIVNAIAGAINKNELINLFIQNNGFKLKGNVHFKDGEITNFNSVIAYRLNFETEIEFGLQIDKRGKLMDFTCRNDDKNK